MEQVFNYINPELLMVSVVLYFIGIWIKGTEQMKDKYIPLIIGAIGIVLCAVWVLATNTCCSRQEIAMAVFTSVVQGVLVAGLSTYVNQVIKQLHKDE